MKYPDEILKIGSRKVNLQAYGEKIGKLCALSVIERIKAVQRSYHPESVDNFTSGLLSIFDMRNPASEPKRLRRSNTTRRSKMPDLSRRMKNDEKWISLDVISPLVR